MLVWYHVRDGSPDFTHVRHVSYIPAKPFLYLGILLAIWIYGDVVVEILKP